MEPWGRDFFLFTRKDLPLFRPFGNKPFQSALAIALSLSMVGLGPIDSPVSASTPDPLDDICNQAATGGTIKAITDTSGTRFCRHTFTTVGSSTFVVRDSRITRVDYLVVAGGGGGAARDVGGGGGAGGLLSNLKPGGTNTLGLAVSSNTAVAVVVGVGGSGSNLQTGLGTGDSGAESSLGTTISAAGGGGGGNFGTRGGNGGSGGGNGGYALIDTAASLATPTGQGNPGGTQTGTAGVRTSQAGGGGGGFSAAGENGTATTAGNGGDGGDFSSFIGADIGDAGWFAGGGGGAQHRNVYRDFGRLGGDGGRGGGGGQPVNATSSGASGTPGTANTGGGGGSATANGGSTPNGSGGNGGSGIVVVRYAIPNPIVELPPSTQQANINQNLLVANMNTRGASVTPQLRFVGGPVTANIAITFGEVAITNLNGATATGSYSAGDFTSSISISGTATQVNAALATLTVRSSAEGMATLRVSAADSPREGTANGETIIYFSGSEILVPGSAVSGETGNWIGVSGVQLSGFSQNVTVTIDSSDATNVKLRLEDLIASSPGQITAPQANLSSFSRGSSGSPTIVINGPVSEVNSALASLEVLADDPSSASVTIQASAGDGQVFEGNGHTYRIVRLNRGITWMDAFAAAAASKIPASGGGFCQGYLVTITSEAERRYVNGKVGGQLVWLGASDQSTARIINGEHLSYVVAAHRLNGDDDATAESKAQEGDFFWVTGPERGRLISSGNWRGSARPVSNQDSVEGYIGINGTRTNYPWGNGEPNNFKSDIPGEDFAHILRNGNWNDYAWNNGSVRSFVIEYGGIKATANHQSYVGAPLGTPKALKEFEQVLDQNLTNPDYVGVKEPCLGVSSDTNKSSSFSLSIVPPPAPTATIGNVTNVSYTPNATPVNSQTDLTLNANLVNDGATTSTIEFEYKVSLDPVASFTGSTKVSAVATTGTGYEIDLAGQPNDHFVHYRLVASFQGGISSITTESATVRTLASPTVNTVSAAASAFDKNANTFTLTLTGTINANNVDNTSTANNIRSARFLFSENPDLSGATAHTVASPLPTGNTTTTVTLVRTNLAAGKTYFYALEATNDAGTNLGATLSIAESGVPSVTIEPAIVNADGSVTLKGTVNPNLAALSKVEFELDTSPSSDPRRLEVAHGSQDGSSPITFSYLVNDAVAGDYAFKLVAQNSKDAMEVQSSSLTFNILSALPPTNLSGAPRSGGGARVSWRAPTGGAGIVDFEVLVAEVVSENCTTYSSYPDTFSAAGDHSLTSLEPETEYCIKVVSSSLAGNSEPSEIIRVTTLAAASAGGSGFFAGIGSDLLTQSDKPTLRLRFALQRKAPTAKQSRRISALASELAPGSKVLCRSYIAPRKGTKKQRKQASRLARIVCAEFVNQPQLSVSFDRRRPADANKLARAKSHPIRVEVRVNGVRISANTRHYGSR